MTIQVRKKCQNCKELRSEEEIFCGNCKWDLTNEPIYIPDQIVPIEETAIASSGIRLCLNGHALDDGDEMCFVPNCGATAVEECGVAENLQVEATFIDEWSVIDRQDGDNEYFESFIVERHGYRALLNFYFPGAHPDLSIYEILNRLPKEYVPELLAHGEWEGRRYDVTDAISKPNLLDLMSRSVDQETVRQIVKSIGRVLHALAENGIRHGNIRPENILIKHQDSLEFLLGGFQYSRVSIFELDTVMQPVSARYTAPEVIAGGISIASDWWSLGMTILQLLTRGKCFDGINEKAFRIHIVTRGISLPKSIDPTINILLRGLLAKDPDQRWQWAQVQKWLAGEFVDVPADIESEEVRGAGPALELNEQSFVCQKAYALAAAEAINWEQAKDLLVRGVVATWLEDRKADPKIIAGVRVAASIDSISDDFKHALALMWMNTNLPLIYKGEIITSPWLLQNSVQGYEIITCPLIGFLRQINRKHHLCELYDRLEKAREKAKAREIELEEESFRVLVLASSRQNLERRWEAHRRLFPGSDHDGLNSFIDRQKITDDELIILLGARLDQYQSAEQILDKANSIALQIGLTSFDRVIAQQWFEVSRRELYKEIEERTANYSRCGFQRVDEWANDFRIQRRISLPRALLLLSVPKESWKEPDRLQYVSRILEFFEKRTASLGQRGPLVRMAITKTGSRVDLARIEGNKPSASYILDHIISRTESPIAIDRIAFENNIELEKKLRHLVSHANTYKRDTGIDSLYLGFPFLVIGDVNTDGGKRKPKIAPILLWPIKINLEAQDKVAIHFDHEREEVRLNPALTGLIGAEEIKAWLEVVADLLRRNSLRAGDVIDSFCALAEARERALCALPNNEYQINAGHKQIVCSAVFFHAQFMGQSLVEDLRQMQKQTSIDTSLETVLRVNKNPAITLQPQLLVSEKERFFTIESDPSQEKAVFGARQFPGHLIEGPPGTGKSQTIVNIISDCIGHGQTVLVVCQKSAALEVLAKRLDAEGLRDRFFYITHVNKDRTTVINSIRKQIEGIPVSRRGYRADKLKSERDALADKIDKIENEIDKHHKAIHEIDDAVGLSYRDLLGQLINIEEQKPSLIDVPSLRRILKNYNHEQLSIIEETCGPLASVWLRSSFEESSLANLRAFSSDKALVDEFISTLYDYFDKEKLRNEFGQQSKKSFDIEEPASYEEWIGSHDDLLKMVNWKNISSWFDLFLTKEVLNGSEIIKKLEEIKAELSVLDLSKHNQNISNKLIDYNKSTVKEWLLLASKVVGFNQACLIKHDTLKSQLKEFGQLLNVLEVNKHDQKLSSKLIDIPVSTIEEWSVLLTKAEIFKQQCFTQYASILKQLDALKQSLIISIVENQDEAYSKKLVNVPTPILEKWLRLTKKTLSQKSRLNIVNPLRFVRLYRIKKILSDLNEIPTLTTINYFQTMVELEKQQRSIREAVWQQLQNVYQNNDTSKPLFPKDLIISVDMMTQDLSALVDLQKIMYSFEDDLIFTRIKKFQDASELEKKLNPIRCSVLNIYEQIYQDAEHPENLGLEVLRNLVGRMLLDLTHIDNLKNVLCDLEINVEDLYKFKNSTELESQQRPLRIAISKLLKTLYNDNEMVKPIFLEDLRSVVQHMIEDLILAQKGIVALNSCPRKTKEVKLMLNEGLPAYLDFLSRYNEAFARHKSRQNCLEVLDQLSPFLCDEFVNTCKSNIQNNFSNYGVINPIIESLPSLSAYLEFRLQAANLTSEELKVFGALRKKEKYLKEYLLKDLDGVIRRLIAREARLSRKESMEQEFPILRFSQSNLNRKILILEQSLSKIHELNKEYLSINVDLQKVAVNEEWEDITRLRGPRARKLREIMEIGCDMGLTQLRPVWLMNPDTASQLLPLRAGMFDVIIFDEASQIPIENALPALYRGKRVVISGDEKQMPPTNVFMKHIDDDEEYASDEEEFSDEMSTAERDSLEDTWNRRDIKDCSDLLALGKTVLPKSMLQIHYRSKYRELIAFSNAAYYGSNLNVPVRHPESVIQSIRPLEVVRVNGIYTNQTNREEAEKVVDLLANIWMTSDRPSIGVVTFNVKQADLIEDILKERADKDPKFQQALSHEREREQEGEDMSFFVKNVENVQGDERDVIIFSSTFGRDEKGIFRRQFGLLSQAGGECRLNVAITRARKKIFIVTSLPINEISDALSKRQKPKNSRDYLQAYFDYASKISDGSFDAAYSSLERIATENPASKMTSNYDRDGFTNSVEVFIKSLGLIPSAIKENDAFGLDFVIEDPQRKQFGIGIECDAHCHPILETARAREVWRPKVISMAIPHVHRVTIYEWYHNREEEMERLKKAIENALGDVLRGIDMKLTAEG